MPARAAPPPAHPDALVAFAVRNAAISSYFSSVQRTGDDSYVLAERTLPDYNLIHLWEGAAVWTIDGVEHRLAAGDLIIVPPGQPHHARSASRRMAFGSLHALAELPGGQDVFVVLAPPRVRRVATASRLDRLFRFAMEEHAPGGDPALIPHWTALVVKELLRHDAAQGLLRARAIDPVIEQVLAQLERRLDRPTSLADLARIAGYTPQHLNRRFRRALGVTPLACLAGLRLEHAASLLRAGRLSVRAVASAVGFDDPAYFSRAFRARFRRSPRDFQRVGGDADAVPADS